MFYLEAGAPVGGPLISSWAAPGVNVKKLLFTQASMSYAVGIRPVGSCSLIARTVFKSVAIFIKALSNSDAR